MSMLCAWLATHNDLLFGISVLIFLCVWGEKRISQQQQEEGEETQRTARKPKQMNKKNQSSRIRKYAKKKTLKLIDYSVQLANLYTLTFGINRTYSRTIAEERREEGGKRRRHLIYASS